MDVRDREKLRREQVAADCDCWHVYTDHTMALIGGVYTGGGKCIRRKCGCQGFQNDATRAIAAEKKKPQSRAGDARY